MQKKNIFEVPIKHPWHGWIEYELYIYYGFCEILHVQQIYKEMLYDIGVTTHVRIIYTKYNEMQKMHILVKENIKQISV